MHKPTLPHAEAAAIAHARAEELQLEADRIATVLCIAGSAEEAMLEARRACRESGSPHKFNSSAYDLAGAAEKELREWAQGLDRLQRDSVCQAAEFMLVSQTYLQLQAWHLSRLKGAK